MLKKWIVLLLVSAVLTVPVIAIAATNVVAKLDVAANIGTKLPTIKLAENMPLQQVSSSQLAVKPNVAGDSVKLSSKIPPQAWLVLTALFCFVMRSSRRVV